MKRLLVLAVARSPLRARRLRVRRDPGARRPPPERAPSAAPPSPAPTCDAGTALRSYAPASTPARARRPAVRLDDGEDPQARPADRRRLRRHLPARLAQPVHRQDRGLRHRHGQRRSPTRSSASPDRVQLRVITAADRLPLLADRTRSTSSSRNMTINCTRWEQIAFSAEYFRSGQKILVRRGSGITGLSDLAGHKRLRPGRHVQPRQHPAGWRPTPIPVDGRQPHRLPAEVPERRDRRDHRRRHRARRPGRAGPVRRGAQGASRSPPSPTASASTATTSTWCASSTPCSSRCAPTASWQALRHAGSSPRSGQVTGSRSPSLRSAQP